MPYRIIFTKEFDKRAAKFLKKHPDQRAKYIKTLQLLEQNPFHPSLRLHPLSGNLKGLYSVSISTRNRITLELKIEQEQIIPVHIGSHALVYR